MTEYRAVGGAWLVGNVNLLRSNASRSSFLLARRQLPSPCEATIPGQPYGSCRPILSSRAIPMLNCRICGWVILRERQALPSLSLDGVEAVETRRLMP